MNSLPFHGFFGFRRLKNGRWRAIFWLLWAATELAMMDALGSALPARVVGDGAASPEMAARAATRDVLFGFMVVLMGCDKFAATISCGFA